jgi:hypothetical protein
MVKVLVVHTTYQFVRDTWSKQRGRQLNLCQIICWVSPCESNIDVLEYCFSPIMCIDLHNYFPNLTMCMIEILLHQQVDTEITQQ